MNTWYNYVGAKEESKWCIELLTVRRTIFVIIVVNLELLI